MSMSISPERAEAIEVEDRIRAAAIAAGGSRHITEIAATICGRDWVWEALPMIGGEADIVVHGRAKPKAPDGAELMDVETLDEDGDNPAAIIVAVVWPWPNKSPELLQQVQDWHRYLTEKGEFS